MTLFETTDGGAILFDTLDTPSALASTVHIDTRGRFAALLANRDPDTVPLTMTVRLVVLDKPTGKGRPRFNPTPGARPFTPKKTVVGERHIRETWSDLGQPRFAGEAPLDLTVRLYVERPKAHYRKDGTLSTVGEREPRPFRKKPDVDNAVKLVMDALEGYAYPRDVAVCSVDVRRLWAQPAAGQPIRVEITIEGRPVDGTTSPEGGTT